MNRLESVHAWLKKSCIDVPHDWIEACLEWIEEENQGQGLSNDQLNNMVYEQWLMTDLRELNSSCLPQQIEAATKVQLSGSYVLQVNSCVDTGIPYYGQLQKLRGTENENTLISGEQTFQPAWQPKPSRLLMLQLTDGTLDVHGMEYKHIPQLKNVVPGTKILIQGQVLCRRGVLMLKSENVQILGGEVESLIETNTAENILESAMKDSIVHANKSERKQFSGQTLSEGSCKPFVKKETFSQCERSSFVQHVKNEISNPPSCDRTRTENTLPWSQVKNNIKKENHCTFPMGGENAANFSDGKSRDQVQPKQEDYEWCDDLNDPFMDDLDDFDMDCQPISEPQKEYKSFPGQAREGRVSVHNIPERGETTDDRPGSNKEIEEYTVISSDDSMCDFKDDFDMEDVEMVKMAEYYVGSKAEMSPVISNMNPKIKTEPCDDSVSDKRSMHSDFSSVDNMICDPASVKVKTEPFTSSSSTVSQKNSIYHSCFQHGQKTPLLIKEEPCLNLLSNVPKRATLPTSYSEENLFNHSPFASDVVPCEKQAKYTKLSTPSSKLSSSKQRLGETSNSSSKLCSASQNRTCVPKAVIHPLQKDETKPTSNKPAQSTLERFLYSPRSSQAREMLPSCSVDTEFTYLSEALKKPGDGKVFLIKGYIVTLTSKLTSRQGREWHLTCRVNDGSAVADMDLSNKVLTELIGFSAPDSLIMRQRAKNDPSLKDILTEGLQQCQQRLVDLSCLMEVLIGPGTSRLSVQRFIPTENKHILVLHHRVRQLMQT